MKTSSNCSKRDFPSARGSNCINLCPNITVSYKKKSKKNANKKIPLHAAGFFPIVRIIVSKLLQNQQPMEFQAQDSALFCRCTSVPSGPYHAAYSAHCLC